MCDIMVSVEDSAKINRIIERFDLSIVDTSNIKTELLKDKAEKAEQKVSPENVNNIIDDLLVGGEDTLLQS